MFLKLHKEKDREESGPIRVYKERISTSSQLHRETKLTEDPKLQGKIEHALRVSLKQPDEGELKQSMSLKQHKGNYLEESGPTKVQDEQMSIPLQLHIKVQDEQISTASLHLRGGRITLWCIQRIQVHFERITVQLNRMNLSFSQVNKSLNYIGNVNKNDTIRKSLDIPTLTKEWSQVRQLAQDCQKSNDMMKDRHRLSRSRLDYERVETLRDILKELETNI
ncbi:uncharacterized protein LOC132720020 [Ruditapes philippinarum]|uniref:uncharacterized protein LOC132720020 n=1 Tax=Ruditapes philippinarum TaxID=129788 RepID=UPI00295B429D|nr:uncharacterized protein LOC132720020 [Ruditapes philippinarum]